MNIKKTVFLAVAGVLIMGAVLAAAIHAGNFSGVTGRGSDDPGINVLEAFYIIDIYDPAARIGDADHVFVGRVDEMTGTSYKFPVMIENEIGIGKKEVTTPHTNYMITVLENIKGDLVTNHSIPVEKAGGWSKDGKRLTLHDNDSLPEVGRYYIFTGYVQDDGMLLVSGPFSNIEITSVTITTDSREDIRRSSEYQEAVTAFQNQKIREDIGRRHVSPYNVITLSNISYAHYDYETLTEKSDLIVVGNVVSAEEPKWSTEDGRQPDGVRFVESVDENGERVYEYFNDREPDEMIYTDIVFSVSDVLKGDIDSDEIVIRSFGGTIGFFRMEDIFNPNDFAIGEKTMLYLVKDNGSIKDIGPEHYVVLPCGKLDPEGDGFVNVLLNEEVDPERVLSLIQSADEE